MRNRVSNILFGIAFVVAGLGFAGNAFGWWNFSLFFDGWWTLFIIIPCLIVIIRNGFSPVPVIGVAIGAMLLLSEQHILDGRIMRGLLIPIILVIIGLAIIFRGSRGSAAYKAREMHAAHRGQLPEYAAIFSAQNIQINEFFSGAEVTAVFGGVDLDLRGAIIREDIVINATAVFGGVDLYLPANVKVKTSSLPIFGGLGNKVRASEDVNAPTVYLNATCIFGGVDAK